MGANTGSSDVDRMDIDNLFEEEDDCDLFGGGCDVDGDDDGGDDEESGNEMESPPIIPISSPNEEGTNDDGEEDEALDISTIVTNSKPEDSVYYHKACFSIGNGPIVQKTNLFTIGGVCIARIAHNDLIQFCNNNNILLDNKAKRTKVMTVSKIYQYCKGRGSKLELEETELMRMIATHDYEFLINLSVIVSRAANNIVLMQDGWIIVNDKHEFKVWVSKFGMGYKCFLVKMREFKFVVENYTPDGKSTRHGKVKNTYVWSHRQLDGSNPKSIMFIDPTKEISQRTWPSANDVWEGVESEQPDAEDACASTAESGVFTNHNKPWTIPVSVPTFDALIFCAMNVLLHMMFISQ